MISLLFSHCNEKDNRSSKKELPAILPKIPGNWWFGGGFYLLAEGLE
jgi:hypothetical protein